MTESANSPKPSDEEPSVTSHVHDSTKDSLVDLCAKGGLYYAQKNYEQAADFYSRATELQVELNGEMSPENAEILFLYGRSLFKLGQSKSDVLGEVSGNNKKKQKSETGPAFSEEVHEEVHEEKEQKTDDTNKNIPAETTNSESDNHQNTLDAKKHLFQFTGDENLEGSEEEEEAQNEENEEEDDDDGDDLAAAFDVLDLARILFEKKLKALEASDDEGKESKDLSIIRRCKERLADTHDQLAEISLENESFPAAVADCRAALAYKKLLFSEEESIIAEAHFKLSLALEFAAITTRESEENENKGKTQEMDQSLRNEAADEMEAAIKSTSLRLQNKELSLSKLDSHDEIEDTRNQITEIKEMLSELQTRLEDLRTPVFDVKSALYGPLVGKLGILNSPTSTDEAVEQAKKTATDVTGLVRKKSKAVVDEQTTTRLGEKRKGESIEENESKRTKVNEVDDIATPT